MTQSNLTHALSKGFLLILLAITLNSCNNSSGEPATEAGFSSLENELKSEFGNDAYYTDLTIINVESLGNIINTTVTTAPESLKMWEWNFSDGTWKQNSEITLEVPNGSTASDFMFQLNDNINLATLGALVEKSKEQLTSEKAIENPKLSTAAIKFPKNGDIAKTEYAVSLQPENGGTTFSFYYSLNGELINMDY